jgi:hypothetical protein
MVVKRTFLKTGEMARFRLPRPVFAFRRQRRKTSKWPRNRLPVPGGSGSFGEKPLRAGVCRGGFR